MTLRISVLTVSDRSASGERPDASGPALVQRVLAEGWQVCALPSCQMMWPSRRRWQIADAQIRRDPDDRRYRFSPRVTPSNASRDHAPGARSGSSDVRQACGRRRRHAVTRIAVSAALRHDTPAAAHGRLSKTWKSSCRCWHMQRSSSARTRRLRRATRRAAHLQNERILI
jgi:hypothetical protein